MKGYYEEKLSSEKLLKVYKIAPPRVQQYLKAELSYVLEKISSKDVLLDLGCGLMGKEMLNGVSNCLLIEMNAIKLGFLDNSYDVVICIQNGISAFHVDQKKLIRESIRVTKPGGTVLFSTYLDKFWSHRLHWFQLQADAGLLGEIDYKKTGDGVIVCKDGFKATSVSPDQFFELTRSLDVQSTIMEVDESSVFCEIRKNIPQ